MERASRTHQLIPVVALVCLVVACGWFLSERERLRQDLEDLRQERVDRITRLEQLHGRLSLLQEQVDEIASSESEMLEAIGVEPLVRSGGQGPYAQRDARAETLEAREKVLRRQLWLDVQRLTLETDRMADLDGDLRRFFQGRAALYSAVPSLRPVAGGRVSSPFGVRADPFTEETRMHWGMDFAHRPGTPVMATAEGRVFHTGWDGDFGRTVWVDHGFGLTTVYAHLQEIRAEVGHQVKAGQVIGLLGSSGRSTNPHLHYEVRVEGRKVNPTYFLPAPALARAGRSG